MTSCKVCGCTELRLALAKPREDGRRFDSMPALPPAILDALPPVFEYFECQSCGIVHSTAMDALDAAQMGEFYTYEDKVEEPRRRNRAARAVRFAQAGLSWWPQPKKPQVLCYGAGKSPEPLYLAETLNAKVATCDYGAGHTFTPESLAGEFNIISSMEVLEHLRQPAEELGRVLDHLAPGGFLSASTGIWSRVSPEARPGWWYANHRQGHITLWSLQALDLVAQRHGCVVVLRGKTHPLCAGMGGLGQFPVFIWREQRT